MLKNINKFNEFEESINEGKISDMARNFRDKITGKDSTPKEVVPEEIVPEDAPKRHYPKMYAPEREKTEEKYVGLMPESDRKHSSWRHDGIFLEFDTKEEAQTFIDDIKSNDMMYNSRKMSAIRLLDKEDVENERNIKYKGNTDKSKISRFVGLMPESDRKHSAWYHNGIFNEFDTKEEAQQFIDDIKGNDMMYNGRKIKTTGLFNKEYMDKMDKVRKQGQ